MVGRANAGKVARQNSIRNRWHDRPHHRAQTIAHARDHMDVQLYDRPVMLLGISNACRMCESQ